MSDIFFQLFLALLGIIVGILSQIISGKAQRRIVLVFGLLLFFAAGLWAGFTLGTSENSISVSPTLPLDGSPSISNTPLSTTLSTPYKVETPTSVLTPNLMETPISTPIPNWIIETYEKKRGDSLFWAITSSISIIFAYIMGVTALIISAWNKGSTIFSRSWLTRLTSKPLLIMPAVGKWALFLGYKKRLHDQPDVLRAATKFFGVPGIDSDGKDIWPDSDGTVLNEAIARSLDSQKPVLVEGKGGGGKTTLLARWSYLALKRMLPAQFKGYQPILVTPAYYADNLVDSIASVLRERDGLAIDKEMAQSQLESGKFLVLFDGVSEILGDQNKGLQEILRTARNADYRNCRFLISTRPGLKIPPETIVFQLRPLTAQIVLQLLPRYQLDREREYQVKKQLTLFGEKPIEPLLFTMIIEQGKSAPLSTTRAQLYERYFRRLLQVSTDTVWVGWRIVLGELSKWFMLDTGRRGVGIVHETLVDKISEKVGEQNTGNLFERSKKYYDLPVESELNLLEKLKSSGIMQQGKRWQFAHDTFEEYFAASYIISYLTRYEKIPGLGLWTINDAQIQSFIGVLEFIKEMADDEILKLLHSTGLPPLWKTLLGNESDIQAISSFTQSDKERSEPLYIDIAMEAFEKGEIAKERYIEAYQWRSWQKWVYRKDETGWRELLEHQVLMPVIRRAITMELARVFEGKADIELSKKEKDYKEKLLSLLKTKPEQSGHELLDVVRESIITITHPRYFQTERGFQGQLVSNLNARLEEIRIGKAIVEEEYQKVSELHGLTIRPDIIIHIPFEGSGFESRKQGNFVVFELKLRATQKEAFDDFVKLEQMRGALDYPLGIFINIDSTETYLENYRKTTDIEVYSFGVKLEGNKTLVRESHA